MSREKVIFLINNQNQTTGSISGPQSTITLGSAYSTGRVLLKGKDNKIRCSFQGDNGRGYLGGHGKGADLFLFPSTGDHKTASQATIHLSAERGDIILRNADCAEDFDAADAALVEAGTVMSLNAAGQLCRCSTPYDTKVVGVVSGAGDFKPGIVLDKHPEREGRLPIALVGKVFCRVDASRHPIDVGDMLTTSDRLGHAMKAVDPLQAFGAVIGKALRPLATGQDLIPILVSLQ